MSKHKKTYKDSGKGSKKKRRQRSAFSGSTDSEDISSIHGTKSSRRRNNAERNGRPSASSSEPTFSDCSAASPAYCQLFPERNRNNKFGQIQIRKTRWGPMLNNEKKETKGSEAKKKRRKEPKEEEKHRRGGEKRNFRPLLDFVDDRKQLAAEILDTLDARTRNRIFPELKGMTETEVRRIVYGFINGISKKRVLAMLQRKDFSDSSFTSDSEDFPNSLPSTSSDWPNRLSNANSTELRKHSIKSAKNNSRKENQRKIKGNKKERELEDGEVISEMEEEEEGRKSSPPETNGNGGKNGEGREEDELTEWEEGAATTADGPFNGDEYSEEDGDKSDDDEEDGHLGRQKIEPQFVISLGFSPPHADSDSVANFSDEEGDDNDEGGHLQRIVCILPSPSPTATIVVGVLSDGQLSEEEEGEEDNWSRKQLQQQNTTTKQHQMEEHSLKVQITVAKDDEEKEGERERGEERETGQEEEKKEGECQKSDRTPEEQKDLLIDLIE